MRKIIVASAFVFLAASPAYAESFMSTLGKSWSCVKASAKSSFNISVEVIKKGATVTEIGANVAACTAVQGGNATPFVATLGAISAIKAASPSTIPTGQCASSIKGLVAKPFAEGLSVIMPPSSIRTNLISLVESEYAKEQMWSAITSIPGVQPYTIQVDCACTTIDGGISLLDVQEVADAVKQTSDSCSTALDSLGLGFINDLGNKAGDLARAAYAKLSGLYDELINNESDPKPREEVYGEYFGRDREYYSVRVGLAPNFDIRPLMDNAIEGCANYYDGHKHAKSTGYKICNEMANRLAADAKVLGDRYAGERHMLEFVQKEWPSRFIGHWAWRLPPASKPGGFPPNPDQPSSIIGAKMKNDDSNPYYVALKATGGDLQCTQTKYPKSALWLCGATGIYGSARQMFVSVKDQLAVLQGAEAGLSARLRADLMKTWDERKSFVSSWYLYTLYPQPAMAAIYGCPSNQPMSSACIADVRKTFDVICFSQIRDAIVNASVKTLSINQPAKKAIETCQAFIKPRIDFANALTAKSVGVNPGVVEGKLCARYQPRTPEMQTCQKLIRDAYDECALTAIKAGTQMGSSNGPFTTCWDKARSDLEASMANKVLLLNPPSVATTPKQTGPITAPKPGTFTPKP